MTYLTIFNIVAGTASIIALLLVVMGSMRKSLRAYEQKRRSAEQELERELARLQAAGGNVSARSDLGFLVLIELGSLRESASYYRHHRVLYLIFAGIMFQVAAIFMRGFGSGDKVALTLPVVTLALAGACSIVGLTAHSAVVRLQRYTESYESRIKEVWARPVYKRSDTSFGPTSGST